MSFTNVMRYLAASAVIAVSPVQAETTDQQRLLDIQQRWAPLNYADEVNDAVVDQMAELAEETHELTEASPDNAEYLIWDGIVHSSLAKLAGGLGALSKVEMAKTQFEKALAIEPTALDGSAYASLGVLYQKVPGWPLGFGSDKKAGEYLQKALAINPDGLDVNFFYADYLVDQDQEQEAVAYLEKALAAPTLANRPVADEGRRAEAKKLLQSILKANFHQ